MNLGCEFNLAILYLASSVLKQMLNLSSFINDTERIADRNYNPTDDDVIRARLRTLGVQEYRFILDHGKF